MLFERDDDTHVDDCSLTVEGLGEVMEGDGESSQVFLFRKLQKDSCSYHGEFVGGGREFLEG